ncbi:hypothetical protein EG328_005238 [Venturia inaequalis]|uniref:Saccharopine dehydrogenase NADP binding domain-containing protein n=1 Tax=Venturia inaequalis TaxID=5025 RepID=A0A8H3VA88_VENIN|nr:hypothetical protein EG328_005238 [Venturia inaequalis]KAE9983998.1 hypothetical protein EG327_005274 [Venturia inaequalis]RDI81529.1 putative acyltransferase [Venturia inaequalis]
MPSATRQYELVLLGATGYTGNLAAEYIQEHVATDLKWAIAGRNGQKLAQIAEELKKMNPDRVQPAIEVVEQKSDQLKVLAEKTQVLITTVGPYARWGEPVVEACANAGTHYLDVTGETPFTYDMLQKYHDTAKRNGSMIIPHCGIDSVPADILPYLCVKEIRSKLSVGVKSCINSLQKSSGKISGGTALTAITLVESYPLTFIGKAMNPYALSPIPKPKGQAREGIMTKVLGYRYVPDLGILTTSPQAGSDTGIVYRSWALFDGGEWYGKNFSFAEFFRAPSALIGTLIHYVLSFGMVALYFAPFRWFLKKLAYEPGQGQTKEETAKNEMRYKCIATSDSPEAKRAMSSFEFVGGGYYMTGMLVVEAAMTVLRGEEESLAKRLGGMVTPACLEMEYVERLRKAGISIECGMMED